VPSAPSGHLRNAPNDRASPACRSGASGFALGLLAIKLCSGLIDGSLLDAGKKWLTNGTGGKK
jgi:hypothetical protein